MLNGIDPIIIFQFARKAEQDFIGPQNSILGRIPFVQNTIMVDEPPIPIYLSEQLTGLYIDTESKSMQIGTDTTTSVTGEKAEVVQKGISSTVQVNLIAVDDSIGGVTVAILSALMDQIFDKVTSKEYKITYMHGSTTIFRALIQSFAITPVPGTNKISISIELTRGEKQPDAAAAKQPTVGFKEYSTLT